MTEDAPEDVPDDETGPDPDLFVGSPPAGDANPGDFASNDQSADPAEPTRQREEDEP